MSAHIGIYVMYSRMFTAVASVSRHFTCFWIHVHNQPVRDVNDQQTTWAKFLRHSPEENFSSLS